MLLMFREQEPIDTIPLTAKNDVNEHLGHGLI